MKMPKYKQSDSLAYAMNNEKDCYSEKGQYHEGERCQKTEVRRQKTKKKEDVMSEDKKDNVWVTKALWEAYVL